MKISPISNYNFNDKRALCSFKSAKADAKHDGSSFQGGRQEAAKFWGEVFGGLSLLSAAETYIKTGGEAITPMVLGYNVINEEPNKFIQNKINKDGIKI